MQSDGTSQQFKDMGRSVEVRLPDCGSQQRLCHSMPRPEGRLEKQKHQ